MLPPDAQAHGFDTNADALGVEPALLDRYLTAAAKIARVAVGDPTHAPRGRALHGGEGQLERADVALADRPPGESFSLGSRGGIAARHYFPVDGEYVFRVRLLTDLCRSHPWAERADRDRDSRRWRTRRAVHDRRYADGASRRCRRDAAGARAVEGRPSPGARHDRSSPSTSRPRDWDRRGSRSGTAKATCRAPSSRSRRC